MITRRTLMRGSALTMAGALAGGVITRPLRGMPRGMHDGLPRGMPLTRFQDLPSSDDTRNKELIHAALEAAKTVGASYTDVRLTLTQEMRWDIGEKAPKRKETMGIGVRTLVDGYWGFASSPVWDRDEAARLARAAVANAKANIGGHARGVELALNPSPQSGEWIMPIKDDPFEMAFDEIRDFFMGLNRFLYTLKYTTRASFTTNFARQYKVFGSSQGQIVTQRLYRTGGNIMWDLSKSLSGGPSNSGSLDNVSPAGAGFEYFRDRPLREYIRAYHEELLEEMELPWAPVEVGRYAILIDASGLANIVGLSLGAATEVDRVMGYEANAGGTSYITDPEEMLGTFKIGSPTLQVTGSRSIPGGCAWTRWDDEGVEPREFALVKDGRLVNLQTHREGCGWIKPYYVKSQQPFTSFGCAAATDAIDVPLVLSADLTVTPASTSDTLADLRRGLDRGIEFRMPSTDFDFQLITGFMSGRAFDIKRGKRVARLAGAGAIFRTTELWNNLMQLGGAASTLRVGQMVGKGEPVQLPYLSSEAPPGIFKEMSVIDVRRKA